MVEEWPEGTRSAVSTESSASGQLGNGDQRVVRARSHVAAALVVAEGGRPAEAERKLRDALGVLERRHRYAAAARAAATLGYLLRERGDESRAESTFERARVLFDVATPVAASFRSPLLELDEERAEREDYVQAKALLTTTTRATAVDTVTSSVRPENDDRPRPGDQSAAIVSAAARLTRTLAAGGDRLGELCVSSRSRRRRSRRPLPSRVGRSVSRNRRNRTPSRKGRCGASARTARDAWTCG